MVYHWCPKHVDKAAKFNGLYITTCIPLRHVLHRRQTATRGTMQGTTEELVVLVMILRLLLLWPFRFLMLLRMLYAPISVSPKRLATR